MDLGHLTPSKGKKSRRVGRGSGSGLGKTCGRGTKGQGSRSGGSISPFFEGGQMPLYRRVPIRGFNNARFTQRYLVINLKDLKDYSEEIVTPDQLHKNGLLPHLRLPVKILSDGEVKKPLEIHAHHFSKKAIEKLESAGGKAHILPLRKEKEPESAP